MIRVQRFSRISGALLLAVAVALAPGCTLFGDTFLTEQPLAEVTVVGKIYIDRATVAVSDNPTTAQNESCPAGSALLWGIARNTGDLDVDNIFIVIDALGINNVVLGTYRVNVFNGEVSEVVVEEPETPAPPEQDPVQIAGTSLAVDESGTFQVCTGLTAGTVVGTAYRMDFTVIEAIE